MGYMDTVVSSQLCYKSKTVLKQFFFLENVENTAYSEGWNQQVM